MDKRSWIDLMGVRYPDFNSNPQYLAAQIGRAFTDILAYAFRNDLDNYSLYAKTYYNVAVEQDDHGNYFSTVPVRIMQMKDSAESVRRITATDDVTTLIFIAIPKDSWSTFNLLEVSKVSKYVPFSLSNNRVEYAKKPPITSVAMDVVRAFIDYEDSDEVAIPSGMEQLFEQLIQSFLQGTPQPDKMNV